MVNQVKRRSVATLSDAEVRGRRVIVRVDFNVPLEGDHIGDDTRIRASLPTIELLVAKGARVILLSHLGRPKGRVDAKYSLRPVASRLAELSSAPVHFCPASIGAEAEQAVAALRNGEVLLLENTRFHDGEEKNDDALSAGFASLGDVFVNDAFGAAHRAHSSTVGIADLIRPALSGLLLDRELEYLGAALSSPVRPFVGILGGAKISGKIDVLEALLPQVDAMLIGGAMACTFLRATGLETGASLVEDERIEMAAHLMQRFPSRLVLPSDAVVASSLSDAAAARTVEVSALARDDAMFDIGPASVAAFAAIIEKAGTVLWNGPMGVFETPPFDTGTREVANALVRATDSGATTIVGGGDSAAAIEEMGLASRVTHVSTGGGASLEFLEGKELPGVAALDPA